jgi:hypothetical protein
MARQQWLDAVAVKADTPFPPALEPLLVALFR